MVIIKALSDVLPMGTLTKTEKYLTLCLFYIHSFTVFHLNQYSIDRAPTAAQTVGLYPVGNRS